MSEPTTDIIRATPVQVRRILATDDHNTVASKLMALEALGEFYKQVRKEIEEEACEWIAENRSIEIGTLRYFVGKVKKAPKCKDVPGAVGALMDATDGDFSRFCEHLGANAIKPGATKKTLGQENYDKLFVVEEEDKLQTETIKEPRKLQKLDTRYLSSSAVPAGTEESE